MQLQIELLRLQVQGNINAAFRSVGTFQRLFVNKFVLVLESDVCLIDKFTLIAKLGARSVKATRLSDISSVTCIGTGSGGKSFGPNGNKCGLTGAN